MLAWKNLSRHFETRADKVATQNEVHPGVFARALAKRYEQNLFPAALPKKRSTHPDLYDRLVAAGVQPDYPTPKPPSLFTVQGLFMSAGLGVFVGISIASSLDWPAQRLLPDASRTKPPATYLDSEFQKLTSRISAAVEPRTNR